MKTTSVFAILATLLFAIISTTAEAGHRHYRHGPMRHNDMLAPTLFQSPAFTQGDAFGRESTFAPMDDGKITSDAHSMRQVTIRSPHHRTRTITVRSEEPQHHSSGGSTLDVPGHPTVIGWARDRFQGFFDELKSMGFPLRGIGCKSSGHQPNSMHHWGGACDFCDQYDRNRAHLCHQLSPSQQIALAHRHHLVSGCEFTHDRRGLDCFHVQVPGSTASLHRQYVGNRYALRERSRHMSRYSMYHHHHHSRRYALAGR